MKEWHGWQFVNEELALHVGPSWKRKRIALYVERGNCVYPLAYFRSEEAAREAMELLDKMARL